MAKSHNKSKRKCDSSRSRSRRRSRSRSRDRKNGDTTKLTFVVTLSGAQEVPPVETEGRGTLKLEFARDFSEVKYWLTIRHLEDVTQAHLHQGGAGVNGGVIATLLDNGGTPDGPVVEFENPVKGTLRNEDLDAGFAANIAQLYEQVLDRQVYVNVHTVEHPTGAIRGQVFA